MHDHSSSWLEFSLEKNSSILPLIQDTNIQEELLQFQELRQGLFSTPIEMGQAFLASSRAVGEGHANWPDLHLLLQQNFKSSDFGTRFKVNVALGRPKSVGNIGFNATAFRAGDRNDTKLAIIDHKFYSEPSDMDVLVEGEKWNEIEEILRILPFRDDHRLKSRREDGRLFKAWG